MQREKEMKVKYTFLSFSCSSLMPSLICFTCLIGFGIFYNGLLLSNAN